MKGIFAAVFLLLSATLLGQTTMEISDLQYLASDQWKGELLYRDYSSEQEVRIPVEMTATPKNERTFVFSYHYPTEPKADNMVRFKVNSSFTKISNNPIIKRETLENGVVKVVTKRKGKDDKRKAWMYYTYLFGPNLFSLTTEIKYLDETSKFVRSRFSFKR